MKFTARRRAMLKCLAIGPQPWGYLVQVEARGVVRDASEREQLLAENDIRALREASMIVKKLLLIAGRRRWLYVITDRGRQALLPTAAEPELQLELLSPELEFGLGVAT